MSGNTGSVDQTSDGTDPFSAEPPTPDPHSLSGQPGPGQPGAGQPGAPGQQAYIGTDGDLATSYAAMTAGFPSATVPTPERAPGVPRRVALRGLLQAPAEQGRPRMRQLAVACAWALVLALGGVVAGIWALITLLGTAAAGWFEPVIIVVGIAGLAFTALAFPLLERRHVPWVMLGLGTVTLIGGLVLTASAA